MGTRIAGAGTDTRDMLVVHAAFRREFRLAPGLVRSVQDGDTARARVVASHLRLMLQLLHVHHDGEDRLLWPRLQQRASEPLAPTVELMEHQHHCIDSIVQALDEPLDRWIASATAADRAMLAAALADLYAALDEHVQAEERHVLPLAARLLTQAEWGELAEEVKTIPARKLPLVFGMLMYEGDPEIVATILAAAPALPRLLMPRLAPRAYARHARRVYKTAAP